MDTIQYYNLHASDFINDTRNVDFTKIQDRFLQYIQPGGLILDLGCGAGRDTKYFLNRGFRVEAVDGSEEICRAASAYTGIEVRQMLFQDLHEQNRYNGIWACASILHLPRKILPQMFQQMRDALQRNGVIYASFKEGTFEGYRDGRYYTDRTEESLQDILNQAEGLTAEELWTSGDVREDKGDQKWINMILRK